MTLALSGTDNSDQQFWMNLRQNGIAAAVARLSDQEAIATTEKYAAQNYHPLPVNVVRAEGARVYDGDGRCYLDGIGAYSALAHGHLSPFVLRTAHEQLDKLTLVSRAMYSSEMALFVQALCRYTGGSRVCPMNTGVEAVETCLKVARKWAYETKGLPPDSAEILVARENFHGRTISIVGFSSEERYRRGFGPFTPGFRLVQFGDLADLKNAVTERTAAVMLEPIQAEGGINVPPAGYLAEVRKLCDQHRLALIWDEVQTGFCRTGKRFAWQHEDAQPDLMAVGKPLGGGIFPVSAAVGYGNILDVLQPGDHGSTFGGNPLGCAIAIAAMAEMEADDFAEKSHKHGEFLQSKLRESQHPAIADVRGKGLLIGVEITATVDTEALQTALLNEGLLVKETRHRTFRFSPPLTTDETILADMAARFYRALDLVAPR